MQPEPLACDDMLGNGAEPVAWRSALDAAAQTGGNVVEWWFNLRARIVRDGAERGLARLAVLRSRVGGRVDRAFRVTRWSRFGLVKFAFAAILGVLKYPSTQTRIAVGQVVVFRSTLRVLPGTSKIVRNARLIGTWVLGYLKRGNLVGRGVLTRKIGLPDLLEPDALVSHRVLQTGDMHSLRNDL